jgi:hypothetical protein
VRERRKDLAVAATRYSSIACSGTPPTPEGERGLAPPREWIALFAEREDPPAAATTFGEV